MPAKDDYERFSALADEVAADDPEFDKEKFVNSFMKRKGYKASTAWSDPEPEPASGEKEPEDMFTNFRKAKAPGTPAPKTGEKPPGERKSSAGFQYE